MMDQARSALQPWCAARPRLRTDAVRQRYEREGELYAEVAQQTMARKVIRW